MTQPTSDPKPDTAADSPAPPAESGAAHRSAYIAGQVLQGLVLGSGLFFAVLKILGAVGKGALFRYQGF